MMTLLVFFTVAAMASRSSGETVRRSRISISIPSLLQNLGGFERGVDHGGVSDDAEIAAFARDVRLADGHDVIFVGNFALDAAIKIFVLEKNALDCCRGSPL
jgi:hypothetical protein